MPGEGDEGGGRFGRDEILNMLAQSALLRFTEQLTDFRWLLDHAARGTPPKPKTLLELGEDLTSRQRRTLEQTMESTLSALESIVDEQLNAHDDEPVPTTKRYPPSLQQIVVGLIAQRRTEYEAILAPLLKACDGDQRALSYALASFRWKNRSYVDGLAQATIPIAVADFEQFLAELLRAWYFEVPPSKESGIKVSDHLIFQYESVDLPRWAADRRIDKIVNAGPQEWQKRSRELEGPDIDFHGLTTDWQAFSEIFARRNALIHNGGQVDDRYLEQAPWEQLSLGSLLTTDQAYVLVALTHLREMAEALSVAFLVKLVPESDDLRSLVVQLTYEGLNAGRVIGNVSVTLRRLLPADEGLRSPAWRRALVVGSNTCRT